MSDRYQQYAKTLVADWRSRGTPSDSQLTQLIAAALREPGKLIDELWTALTPEKRHELNLKWRDSSKLPKQSD